MEKGEKKEKIKKSLERHHHGGAAYGLGMIGVFIYYLQNSTTFMEGLIGFVKSIFWPAFLLHKIYTILGM